MPKSPKISYVEYKGIMFKIYKYKYLFKKTRPVYEHSSGLTAFGGTLENFYNYIMKRSTTEDQWYYSIKLLKEGS